MNNNDLYIHITRLENSLQEISSQISANHLFLQKLNSVHRS